MSNSNWLPLINRDLCTDCGKCVELAQVQGKAAVAHPDLCTYCAVCEELCPVQAINLPYLIVKKDTAGSESTLLL
jgi:NAD-dependent dihydropyrimidine dehydrogenase PreA subunit